MREQRGFLYYDQELDHYGIDWRESLSLVSNVWLLEEILAARQYMRGRLLDVGCGKRPYALIYESLVESSVGTEALFSPHGLLAADTICFAETLPFADNAFDTILCTEVLEHTRQPFQVMREFARLIQPGGYLILSVPFIYPTHEAPHDFWRFTAYGLENLCQLAGLESLYVHTKGGVGGAFMSLGTNIATRAVNGLSKRIACDPPLRDHASVRWSLALPQWAYLWCAQRTSHVGEPKQLDAWMPVGFVLVAQRPALS